MFSTSDTIVAIATPPGRGGIGVVRVSGPDALLIARTLTTCARALEPRRATFTRVRLTPKAGNDVRFAPTIDQVVATYFPAPHSYTGDDVVEMSAHGSPVVLREIVAGAVSAGARLAEPGEFTLRAYLHGRIDLAQAEAVADLIDAVTPLQARAAFDQLQGTLTARIGEIDAQLFDLIAKLEASVDFPEEGYHFIEPAELSSAIATLLKQMQHLLAGSRQGRLLREGFQITIVGKPNVGKSSVFNALVGVSRAIVGEGPGTTRDLVTESVEIDGLRVTLVDTAGLRDTNDRVEAEGVRRAVESQTVADVILVVLDGGSPLEEADRTILAQTDRYRRVVVANKADLEPVWADTSVRRMSARTGAGLRELREELVTALDVEQLKDTPAITNIRHIGLVESAREALERAATAAAGEAGTPLSEEFVLADLQEARAALDEVVGRRTPDDVLKYIFSKFCVGK